jgi:hypothetical protein
MIMKPPGMPPYPKSFAQREEACQLISRKRSLINDMVFMEEAMTRGNFQYYVSLLKARIELKEINGRLSEKVMNNYERSFPIS